MADTKQERFPDYPIFKGLQRPLEFFGLQGRYIYWAAATAGGWLLYTSPSPRDRTRYRMPSSA